MWLLREAPAAGTDSEWISVVSHAACLPAWPPTKRTICGLTLQKLARKKRGPLTLIKFDILTTLNKDKLMFPLVTRSSCNFS